MYKKPKKSNSLFTGLIVGGAVGSVLSLLFATKKGREVVKKSGDRIVKSGKTAAERFAEKYRR
jgi:gas vesicle protein